MDLCHGYDVGGPADNEHYLRPHFHFKSESIPAMPGRILPPLKQPPHDERRLSAPLNWEVNNNGGQYSPQNTDTLYGQFRTFLNYDYIKRDSVGRSVYPAFTDAAGTSSASRFYNDPDFGPSSGHPAVVNHLFTDGAVRSLDKAIDVATYMFLITRASGDPFALNVN